MSNRKKRSDPNQMNFLETDYMTHLKEELKPAEASLLCGLRIKSFISESIKESDYSRDQVIDRMSAELGVEITLAKIDAWTAKSKGGHRFPLEYLPAFGRATGNWTLVSEVNRMCGGRFAKGKGILNMELGDIRDLKKELIVREKAVEKLLEEMAI